MNNAISTKQIVQNTDINKEKQQINESNDASKNIIGSKRDNFVPTTPKFSSAGKKFNFRRTPPLPSAKDTADISVPNINNNINLVRKRYDQGREYYNNVRVSKNTGNVKKIGKTCSMMTKEDRINTCETGVVDARNKLQIPQEKHCVNEILSCRNDNGGTTLPSESTTAAGKTIKSIPRVHSDFSLTTNRPNSTTTDIENSSHLSRSNSTPNFKRQSATSNSENCSTPSYSRQNHLNIEKSIKKLSSFANQGSNVEQTSFKTADDFSKRTENHGLSSNSCSRLAEKTKQSSEGRPKDKDCLNTVQVCTDKDNDSARAKGNFISPTNGLGKADSNSRDGGTFVSPTSRHFNSRKGFVLLDRRKEISATKGPYCSEGKRKSDEFCHSPDVMKITPLKKRKFPGPAGLLPKLVSRKFGFCFSVLLPSSISFTPMYVIYIP